MSDYNTYYYSFDYFYNYYLNFGYLIFVFLLFSLFLIVGAFIVGLFVKDSGKFFSALRFLSIAFFSLTLIFVNGHFLVFILPSTIIAAMIIMTMRCERKYVLPVAWVVTSLLSTACPSLFIIFEELGTSNSYTLTFFILSILLTPISGLGFLTAATVIRVKKKKNGAFAGEDMPHKSKMLVAGNVLSALSYVAFVFFIKTLLFYAFSIAATFYFATRTDLLIIEGVVTILLGAISFFPLRHTRKETEDCFTAMDTALYIWSWIVIAVTVVIVIVVMICLMVMSSMGDPSYMKSGKRVVTDEKGKKHKLNYNGGEKEEVADESGTVWVTDDGGMTFRKRDTYIYVDEDMKKHYLQDKIGGAHSAQGRGSSLEDNKGVGYDVGLWGDVTKQKLWDDEHDGILGTIQQSDAVKADVEDN